jgi:hypothetical protein
MGGNFGTEGAPKLGLHDLGIAKLTAPEHLAVNNGGVADPEGVPDVYGVLI